MPVSSIAVKDFIDLYKLELSHSTLSSSDNSIGINLDKNKSVSAIYIMGQSALKKVQLPMGLEFGDDNGVVEKKTWKSAISNSH